MYEIGERWQTERGEQSGCMREERTMQRIENENEAKQIRKAKQKGKNKLERRSPSIYQSPGLVAKATASLAGFLGGLIGEGGGDDDELEEANEEADPREIAGPRVKDGAWGLLLLWLLRRVSVVVELAMVWVEAGRGLTWRG